MARMTTKTLVLHSPDWLPEETVTIKTFCGAADAGSIDDARRSVQLDPVTGKVLTIDYTPGRAETVRRRIAVVGWTLVDEDTTQPIPFTPENVEQMDPAYAAYVDDEIQRAWDSWKLPAQRAATTPEEAKAAVDSF